MFTLRDIKYAYQRVRYGYDERIKWEFDSYFSQFLKPLKEFCEDKLRDCFDKRRKKIFSKTLKLIKAFEEMKPEEYYLKNNAEAVMWSYIGKHLGWYWD